MTLVDDRPDAPVRRPGILPRAWALPLPAHVGALAVVLLALVPLVGTSSSFSTDEGAAIVQAQSLSRGDGWLVEHPLPEVDPDGRHYPLEISEHGERGFVPFGKHPLYPLLLAGADRVGGVTAMVLLSLAGTVAAAGLAALLARRMDRSVARPTVWAVGGASPLLFDGFLVMGHSLGAALATAAVLAAVVALERRSTRLACAVPALVVGAVLLRTEALFLAVGMAIVAAAVAVARRELRLPAVLIGLGSLVAGGGGHLVETWWLSRLIGTSRGPVRPAPTATDTAGYLSGRWRGFVRTLLAPTYGGDPLVATLLLAMVAGVVLMALTARNHPDRRGPLRLSGAMAASAGVLAVVTAPEAVVPGLVVAFPLAAAGLLMVRRTTVRTAAARIALAVFSVFAVCVVATQYAVGGGTEWGGRFFAVGVPLLVPVLLVALKDQRLDRWVAASLVVCSVAMATLSMTSLRTQHRRLSQLTGAADEAGAVVAAGRAERPVMVATYASVPRWGWRSFDRHRWLVTEPKDLQPLLGRLREAGVTRIGLVSPYEARDRALLGSAPIVWSASPPPAPGWSVFVVALA